MRVAHIVTTACLMLVGCGDARVPSNETAVVNEATVPQGGKPQTAPEQTPAATPNIPDPTADDAENALVLLSMNISPNVRYGRASAPTGCRSGLMDGREVRSCRVCAVHVIMDADMESMGTLYAQRAEWNIPFRRAISHSEPDIAPMNPAEGVWVFSVPQRDRYGRRPDLPSSTALERRDLGPSEMAQFGISMEQRGRGRTYNYLIREGDRAQIILNRSILLDRLTGRDNAMRIYSMVGSCTPLSE